MKTFTVNKVIGNPLALRSKLLAGGWSMAALVTGAQLPGYVLVSVGDVDPDPTAFVNAYVDPPVISAVSNKAVGPFGHYQASANGADTQIITIRMKDAVTGLNVPWGGNLIIQPMTPISISSNTIAIVNGAGTFTVGPTSVPSEYDIWVQLQTDTVGYTRYRLHLSFF
jgi:hypothetical protein